MAYSQNSDLIHPARRHFGGWVAAKQRAGVGPIRQPWTPERVLAEVRAYDQRLLDSILPHSREFDCLQTVAWRYFGSWANALAAANLNKEDPFHVT